MYTAWLQGVSNLQLSSGHMVARCCSLCCRGMTDRRHVVSAPQSQVWQRVDQQAWVIQDGLISQQAGRKTSQQPTHMAFTPSQQRGRIYQQFYAASVFYSTLTSTPDQRSYVLQGLMKVPTTRTQWSSRDTPNLALNTPAASLIKPQHDIWQGSDGKPKSQVRAQWAMTTKDMLKHSLCWTTNCLHSCCASTVP